MPSLSKQCQLIVNVVSSMRRRSRMPTLPAVFFCHSLDLYPYHSFLTNITVRVTEINSTWGNYVYLHIFIYCFALMVVKFATPSVPFWTKKNKVQMVLYAHYVQRRKHGNGGFLWHYIWARILWLCPLPQLPTFPWLRVIRTWGPPDAGPACQWPNVKLG